MVVVRIQSQGFDQLIPNSEVRIDARHCEIPRGASNSRPTNGKCLIPVEPSMAEA